jgi:hypothetical protein
MTEFIRVNNMNEVRFSDRWQDAAKFDSRGRFIDKEGKFVTEEFPGCHYRVSVKKERYYTTSERVARAVAGLLVTVLTLGLSNFSKPLRGLFTRSKKVLRFAIKILAKQELQPPIAVPQIQQQKPIVPAQVPQVGMQPVIQLRPIDLPLPIIEV